MANKRLNAIISIGGNVSASLKAAIGGVQRGIGNLGQSVSALRNRQELLNRAIRDIGKAGGNISGLRLQYASVTAELDKQLVKLRQIQARNASIASMNSAQSDRRAKMGGMVMGGAVAVATAGVPIVQAVKFESAMLGVAKQLDGARDASSKLTPIYFEMGKAIQQMGREIPIATNELAAMVAAGLRMGVAKDEVLAFTKNAAMMAEAFEADPAELADQMGKIATLYKIPIPAISGLADTINYLDDNAISKGKDIIDFLTRTGGVAGAVKVTGQEMAALGSTLLTLGERTETASTATNAMFQKFAAADKGTKKFKAAMKEIGLSTAAIQKGMQVDAQGTLLKVLEAVQKLPEDKRLGVMVELVGLEHSDTMAKLAGNIAEYRKQIALAGSDKAKGSMSREFAARMETTSAQWEIFKNKITEVGVNIGAVLLPPLNAAMGAIGKVVAWFADFSRDNPLLVKNIVTIAAAFAGLGAVKLVIMGVVWAFTALKIAVMTNPIGILIAAVIALAAVIYQNWGPIKEFMTGLWAGIKNIVGAVWDWFLTKMSWHPLAMIVNNWSGITGFFSSLWEGVKSIVGWHIDWIMNKVALVFRVIEAVKSAAAKVGGALSTSAGALPAGTMQYDAMGNPTGMSELPTPSMAGAKGSSSVTNNTTANITVNAPPGADTKAIAEETARLLKRQQATERGSRMYDGANQ